MNRNRKVAAIAAGLCALAGSLLAEAMGLEGWAKAAMTGVAAGVDWARAIQRGIVTAATSAAPDCST